MKMIKLIRDNNMPLFIEVNSIQVITSTDYQNKKQNCLIYTNGGNDFEVKESLEEILYLINGLN